MFIAKELVDLKEIIVLYLNTKRMPAYGASKSLEGKPQKDFADFVLETVSFTS